MEKQKKFVKPTQFAEHEIIKAIVSDEWVSGQNLPPERELAELLGVTRPTLREVLQRLSRDGWITIKHGRPTVVNDYKNDGGLGVLKTLSNFQEFASNSLIRDWLEFRVLILPDLAYRAILSNSDEIIDKLNTIPDIDSGNVEFATFDWELQLLLISYSQNSIARMLYNDLTEIYHRESTVYYEEDHTRKKSQEYYKKLKDAIQNNKSDIKQVIKQTMQESLDIWERVNMA
ncbi:MAG: GntR family transcriptional regulator [Bacteroidetes bacterium]|nr:MAG: GntR family transcriptional regulator [Bacteroidota bacterium]